MTAGVSQHVGHAPGVPPPEAWERVSTAVRGIVRGWAGRHPALAARAARLVTGVLWAALAFLLVVAALVPRYRTSLAVYAACLWLLLVWYLLARTRTVRWASVARMFAAGLLWAPVVGLVTAAVAGAAGLRVDDVGAGTAIAALGEETLKLVPLALVVAVAPGRARRFACVDWLLLGVAAGLGFQAFEELLRRLKATTGPGTFDPLFTAVAQAPGSGYPQYGLGPLSGGAGRWVDGEVWGLAGHHVLTGLTAVAVGLALALWRAGHRWSPVLPAAALGLAISDHFGFNASLVSSGWATAPDGSAPGVLQWSWQATGQGTGRGWLLLALLVVALLVDADRLYRAGPVADLPGGPDRWWARPRHRVDDLLPRVPAWLPARLRVAAPALAVFAARDVAVLLAAYAPEEGTPRWRAVARGRVAAGLVREVREVAVTVGCRRPDARAEVRARLGLRLLAAAALAALVLVATLVAAPVAARIDGDLMHGGAWLADLLEWLQRWWDSLSPAERLLVGAGIGALVALAAGSLGVGLGASGAATWGLDHGVGLAAVLHDPRAATRRYLTTTTPAGVLVDVLEFGLTVAPGGGAGALAGKGARSYLDDVARARGEAAMLAKIGQPLSQAERAALAHYTENGYHRLNGALRAGGRLDPLTAQRVTALSAALEKLPVMKGSVFRATNLTPEQISRYRVGKIVTEEAFTSTTLQPDLRFTGSVEYFIKSETGRKIATQSAHPGEAEVLFDRGTRFRVLGNQQDLLTGKTYIYLEEVR